MNRVMKVRLSGLVLLAVALSGAASAQGIGLSPAIINQKFKPGETFTTTISVMNGGSQPAVLKTMTSDLWFNPEDNERTILPPGTHPRSASNWVEFVPGNVIVPANGTVQIKLVVTPRKDVEGGYYSILFFETRPELTASQGSQSVFTNFRIGALLLLTAQGTEKYQVSIYEYELTPPDATHKLHVQFVVDNQSNTHIYPRVQLVVLDSKKTLLGKTDGDMKRFMPGQKNVYSVDYPGELKNGSYTAVLTIIHEGGEVITREIPFQVTGAEDK